MADLDLEPRGEGGGGDGLIVVAPPAFLPFVIPSFLPQNKGEGGQDPLAPLLDFPLLGPYIHTTLTVKI